MSARLGLVLAASALPRAEVGMAGMVASLEGFGSGPPKGSRRGLSSAEQTSLRTCSAIPL